TARVTSADARCVREVYRTAEGGVAGARPHRLASLGTSFGGRGVRIARLGTGRARSSAVRAQSVDPRDAGVTARVTSADANSFRRICQEDGGVQSMHRVVQC